MPRDEMFSFTNEVDELVDCLTSKHKIECKRETKDKSQEVLEFKVSYGTYRIVCDSVRERFYIYCEENYSKDGFEYYGSAQKSNGVCYKISIW
jgi:hypothetical protein